ncbi:DUF418 domain-containing protein [Kribbella sp. NPDC004536]|uniref:DUF418 domain-containing protein n=1 Tax=Kribbella sp. NPDC004536 TaxID=3364106 RepID=UPI00369D4AD5
MLWQRTLTSDDRLFWFALATGGLVVAAFYVCTLLALLTTRIRSQLIRIFSPLGRMALTNYLTATMLVLTIIHGLDLNIISAGDVVLIAAAILTTQWMWSTLWLRRFTQGPFEWLWRWATWAERPPIRIARTEQGALGAEDRLRRVR